MYLFDSLRPQFTSQLSSKLRSLVDGNIQVERYGQHSDEGATNCALLFNIVEEDSLRETKKKKVIVVVTVEERPLIKLIQTDIMEAQSKKVTRPGPGRDLQEKQPTFSVNNPHSMEPRKPPSSRTVVFTLSVIFVALVIALPIVLHYIIKGGGQHRDQHLHYCETQDCINHARMLNGSMNASVRLCNDFASFVCGNNQNQAIDQVLRQRSVLSTLRRLGSPPSIHSAAIAKARAFFESCSKRNVSGAKSAGLEAFKNFMLSMNLSWPDPPQTTGDLNATYALDVLLSIAMNWQICIWMQAQFYFTSGKHQTKVILISRCNHRELSPSMRDHDYEAYVNRFCKLFFTGQGPCIANLAEFRRDEDLVRNYTTGRRPLRNTFQFFLSDIDTLTPSIPTNTWVELLNKILDPPIKFTNYVVLAKGPTILSAVENIISKLPLQRILTQISWEFIQRYAWVAIPEAAAITLGSMSDPNQVSAHCLAAVEETMGLLLRAEEIYTHYSREERKAITQIIEGVKNATLQYLENSGWIMQEKIVTAIVRLSSMQQSVWPPDEFFDVKELDNLYSTFPDMKDDFFTNWINSHKALAAVMRETSFSTGQLYVQRYDSAFGLFSYMNYINVMDVSLVALQNPLYYRLGTAAINYGGLGAMYALEFLKGLYGTPGVTEEVGEDSLLDWIFKFNETVPVVRNAPICFLENGEAFRMKFPTLPALQVAHKAFKAVQKHTVDDPESDLRLRLLGDFTADGIFFLSFCHAFCGHQELCNLAVSNSEAFSKTFLCPAGTAVNPESKCSFFSESTLFQDIAIFNRRTSWHRS
ncbi:endothelin-converting enzyme 2-like [Ornithodoros turicata]|uniref:endothelin-converting enzyme 2-like n=1 Tax=Ornithodoros turicata TaxID=34597 RepID=UPI003139B98D